VSLILLCLGESLALVLVILTLWVLHMSEIVGLGWYWLLFEYWWHYGIGSYLFALWVPIDTYGMVGYIVLCSDCEDVAKGIFGHNL
jgi:hypothetical protein